MILRGAYRFLSALAGPILKVWLKVRARRGKEDASRLSERVGIASLARPEGSLAWVHAASVGESLSILPLIEALKARGWHAVITTGTVTSAQLLKDRLPANAVHQFAPLDRRAWVERFFDHWRPDLVLWTESELWPNSLAVIAARNVPSALVNARMSDRAFRGWQRRQAWAAHLLGGFSTILAQSEEDARRFTALGGGNVHAVGNLKYAAEFLPVDSDKLDTLRAAIGARPVWLAASIHPGEDEAVASAQQVISQRYPELLTIVVPRHPNRGLEMAASISKAGLKVARRSANDSIVSGTNVYMADTLGELGLFYTLCDIVFIGKSLATGGGQNPVEPAQSGCALLFGPDMSNFRDAAFDLLKCGAAIEIVDGPKLGAAVSRLLEDESARMAMIDASHQIVMQRGGSAAETITHLETLLAQSLS
jgi:3-deoxy-D-manno-octulosonic-acid transferase